MILYMAWSWHVEVHPVVGVGTKTTTAAMNTTLKETATSGQEQVEMSLIVISDEISRNRTTMATKCFNPRFALENFESKQGNLNRGIWRRLRMAHATFNFSTWRRL
eukprot:gb/GEZN01019057.1/.p2 GENE.gb/GEZN01019057.1/~~gb/GEZN01019057.1/.p2  ORF type:complete len:106 (+),score=2.22 gb/GEZN01019057.1/:348-665(+)